MIVIFRMKNPTSTVSLHLAKCCYWCSSPNPIRMQRGDQSHLQGGAQLCGAGGAYRGEEGPATGEGRGKWRHRFRLHTGTADLLLCPCVSLSKYQPATHP